MTDRDRGVPDDEGPVDPHEISRILLRAGASLDSIICPGGVHKYSPRVRNPGELLGEMSAEQLLAWLESNHPPSFFAQFPPLRRSSDGFVCSSGSGDLASGSGSGDLASGKEHWRALKNLVYGTRTRRAIARLRSYAIRGRVTAEVRLLDDGALARVKLYNSLFGLPHDLFKEIVSKL